MATVSDLVTEIQASGFDVTTADALALLDRRHKQMCNRARWWRKTGNGVTTTTTISTVNMPADAVEIFLVRVVVSADGSMILYQRTLAADLEAIFAGTLTLCGPGGVFNEIPPSSDTDPAAVTQLVLYPPPATNLPVLLDGAYTPPTLNTAETAGGFIRVPVDFYDSLLSGVYATLLRRPNEARPDLADEHEAVFTAACDELRDRGNRRYRTKGPRQIRIGGFDA